MSNQDEINRVWEVIEKVGVCMMTTRFSKGLREIWDGPASSAVAACEFAKARATGKKPNLGEKRKSTVKLK